VAGLLGIIMDYNNEKQLSDPLLPSAESGSGPEAAPGRRSSIFAKTVGIAEDVVTRPVDIMKSSTFVDDYNKVRAEALPLTKAGDTGNFFHNFRWGDPNHDPTQREIAKVSLWRMFSYSTVRERCLMVLGLVLSTFTGLGIPAWLVLLAQSLDTFSNIGMLLSKVEDSQDNMDYLMKELTSLCTAFAVVGLICLVTGFGYVSIFSYTGEMQSLRIQKAFVRASLNQDAAWFDTHNRETLPTKMGTALVHINNGIGRQIVDVYSNAISAAGCLAVALVLNTKLALVMLCVVPFAFIILMLFNFCIRRVKRRASAENSSAGGIATESLAGIKTVASLCAQPHFTSLYSHHISESSRLNIRASFLSSLVAGVTGGLFYVTYIFAFYIGTEQVAEDMERITIIRCLFSQEQNCRVTGASVMCCIYGVILCVTFFGLMGPGLSVVNLARSAAVEVFDTLLRQPPIDPSSDKGTRIDGGVSGKIEFKKLCFTYPSAPDRPIFYDFNLTIEPGQSVALVGPSGSGKSTIARFLLRFYDPNQGSIIIDEKYPLNTLNISWFRSQVGYVAQDPLLFPGTIRDNIAMGLNAHGETATNEQVYQAAKDACAHDFILGLPDGYDTYYGGTSVQFSGGQLQRICIARALIRNPSILILDEATSALDQMSETHVQNALAHIREHKKVTTVTIAHRLTTIIDSDTIAVINGGKIAELGDHKTLIEKENGIYRTLCESQGIKPEDDATSGLATSTDDADIETKSDVEDGKAEGSAMPLDDEIPQDDPTEVPQASMSSIWRQIGGARAFVELLIGIVGSGLVGCLSPCESILTAQIVTNFYTVDVDDMLQANKEFIVKFFYFALAALVGNMMVGYGLGRSGNKLAQKLRIKSFGSMMNRSMGWFDLPEHTTGDLTSILGADVEAVSGLVGLPLGYRVRALVSLLTGISIALKYSIEVGIVAVMCVPLIMIAGLVQSCCVRRRFASNTEGLSPGTIMEQGLRGIASVQAYGLESKVGADYEVALEPESNGKVKQGMVAGAVFGFTQFSVFVSFALVFFVGSQLLIQVKIDFISFFTSVLAVMFGALGASTVAADFNSRQKGLVAAARIYTTFYGPSDGSHEDQGTVMPIEGDITFQSVKFSYPSRPDSSIFYESDTMDGVSLHVAPGESIGLVGRSGSGKSTVLQIVMRFYDITGGSASLDKKYEFADVNVKTLRSQIGYVGQLPTLFNGTVKENILLGKEDATDDEIIAACKLAQCHEFVLNLADGYDTHVGPGGNILSGGQKQRVAIARAIIKQPRILILDEATAALDNESQKLVQAALDDLSADYTTLTVAHRLLTVKNCTKIAFLGDGGVLECGSHEELVALKGNYRELWNMQGGGSEEAE